MPLSHQPELFPLTTSFRPHASLNEPHLWIRELRVYRVLNPGSQNLLRSVTLRPGLNVLWARPSERGRPAQLHTPGLTGHGTGKTTFARFVRHILGEPTFANEEQRSRLRSAFPEGWIIAEVRIAAEPWIVCRPFKIGTHSICYRGRSVETLFANEAGRTSWDDYLQHLDATLAEPLPVTTFATAPNLIRWAHILQWLARDQECRFASLAEFRHPTSESQAPDMAVEDRHFLFRGVLGLIDTAEQSELENNKSLLQRRNQAEKNAPLLRFRSQSALKRLRQQKPDFRTDLDGAALLQTVETEWTAEADTADRALAEITEPESLRAARTAVFQEEALLHAARHHCAESEMVLAFITEQRRALNGETTADELQEFIRLQFSPDLYCGQPLSSAIEWECPLVRTRLLPAEAVAEGTAPEKPTPAEQAAQLDAREQDEQRRLATGREKIGAATAATAAAQAILQRETAAFDQLRAALAGQSAQARALAGEASRALTDQDEADKLERSLERLDKQIRTSLERQASIREQNHAALSTFADSFNRITRAILGDGVQGEIRFRGRQIRPTLIDRIDLTSAALETLKVICFDLAALVHGLETGGCHPRFLLHDGPREADMDVELYQRLFLLVSELESACGANAIGFQYIVTTTEPPPPELCQAPWLLSPVLSAVNPADKFLGEDF